MPIERLDRAHAPQAAALLGALRVSLFGVQSAALHRALVDDGIAGRIDFRIAFDGSQLEGLVVAAPKSYWLSLLLRHWGIALGCVRARLFPPHAAEGTGDRRPPPSSGLPADPPSRSWSEPGDAWRIIIVGTAADSRGKGVAGRLYRSVMAERSLVARIAADNAASLRLHESLGWRLVADGDVVLAVHGRGTS
jgi:hypothetical protein